MEKLALIYIGKKPFKKDTVTGSGTIFPQGKSVPVPADIGYRLLKHPDVWIRADSLEEYQAGQRQAEELRLKQSAEQQRRDDIERQKRDMTCGEYGDLGKLTAAQLRTLVEGAELEIDPQGAQEKVDDFRLRVRDSLREKIAAEDNQE